MKFRIIYQQSSNNAQSPMRVIEQTTGQEVGWINRYLDREYVRRLANTTLRTYAYNLLHFVRWWASIHHTGAIVEQDLSESTLLDYLRFQSSQGPRPSASTINDRIAVTDRAYAIHSRKLPVRWRAVFIKHSCGVDRWAWLAHERL